MTVTPDSPEAPPVWRGDHAALVHWHRRRVYELDRYDDGEPTTVHVLAMDGQAGRRGRAGPGDPRGVLTRQAARRPAARRMRTISAADGVTAPVAYVDRRDGEVPMSAANRAWVRPDSATS